VVALNPRDFKRLAELLTDGISVACESVVISMKRQIFPRPGE
jgi:hypothetical protein